MALAVSWQRIEGALVLLSAALAVAAVVPEGWPWWALVLLFFAPDLSFAGYLAGARAGAAVYNVVHVYGFGGALLGLGLLAGAGWLAALGALWLGHAGVDRALGYGLKLPSGFQDTHLGRIGGER